MSRPDPILEGDLAPKTAQALGATLRALMLALPVLGAVSALFVNVAIAIPVGVFFATIVALHFLWRSGRLVATCYGLVGAMIALGAASTAAYGSVRGLGVYGFVSAIVLAGIFLGPRGLAATLAASSAALGALVHAEGAGWLVRPSFEVGPAYWIMHSVILAVIAVGLHNARRTTVETLLQLDSSRKSMTALYRSSPAALIISTQKDGRVIDINASYERTFAMRHEDAVGKTVLELGLWAHASDRDRYVALMKQDGRVTNFSTRLVRRNGEKFDALMSAEQMEGESEPLLLAFILDVSAEVHVQDALRRSEARFRQMFEFSPIGMLITRVSDGRYLDANRADEQTLGYSREELLGRTVFEIGAWASPEDRARFLARLREEKIVQGYETTILTKAGEPAVCRISGSLVELDGEECVLSAIINVTEHKRVAEAETQLRAKFEALFSTSPEGIAVTRLRGGVLTEANDAACEQLGCRRDEVLGRPIPESGIGVTRQESASIVSALLNERRIVNRPTRFRRFDGTWLDLLLSAVVVRLDRHSCVVWSWRDVTALRKAEATLQESEERFRGLTELFASYFWETDADWRFTMVQGRGLREAGRRPEDILGRRSNEIDDRWELVRPSQAEFDAIRAARQPYRDVLSRYRMPDGSIRYLSIWGEPRFAADGTFLGFRGVTQDVTEQMRLEQEVRTLNETLEHRVTHRTAELEAANKELESFSYSVSHDLRAPLRAIGGFSAVIREQYAGGLPAEAQRYFSRIEQNADHMRKLVDDLLELARAGRIALARTALDMRALAEEAAREVAQHTPHSATLVLGELQGAVGDPVLLRQVWRNLIGNAVKFSRGSADPRIEVSAEPREGKTWYCVRDNGAGFDMQYADKLFGTFQRLHSAAEFEGTGVGLAIVRRIVERHGGRVSAESQPGSGAKFGFTLGDSAV